MSEWEPAVLDRYLSSPMEKYTSFTLVEPDRLREQLPKIQEAGVSWAVDEFEMGLTAVSAPIRDRSERIMAAVNVWGPGFRFPGAKSQAEINESVIAAGNQISERLQRLQ